MSNAAFCPHCGAPARPGDRFCESCGRPLAAPPSPPPPLPPGVAFAGAPPHRRSRAWVAMVPVAVALVAAGICFLRWGGSASPAPDRAAASLQTACDAKDCKAATALVHPSVRASYGKLLTEHEAELPRLGKLLATRKLLAANADVAEYEVTEDGETFIITFERHGSQWFLVGL